MNDTIVTLQGWVGGAVTLRRAGETTVASFRLGCTPRHYRRDTNIWVDDHTQWFTVSAWRGLGDNCEASLRRGDAVVVQGRLRLSIWADANGVEQQTWEVVATSVGHDLNRGTSRFVRPARPEQAVEEPPEPTEPTEPTSDSAEVAA